MGVRRSVSLATTSTALADSENTAKTAISTHSISRRLAAMARSTRSAGQA